MAGLPHHWNAARFFYGFGQRLRRFDIEHDRLTFAGAGEHITSVDDQQVVAPDDLAITIDHADTIGVAIEGDAEVGSFPLHGANQVLEILWNGRIRVMVRESAVALAEQIRRRDAKAWKETRYDKRAGAVTAVENHLEIAR